MIVLDGKKVRDHIFEALSKEIKKIDKSLGLAVIQIGNDPASSIYIKEKEKMTKKLGINFYHHKLDSNIKEEDILSLIDKLNKDNQIDGILVQMPIPSHLDSNIIQNRILPEKDVDGLTDINAGRLLHNRNTLIPCTPLGITTILDYYSIDIEGKNIVILGRSNLVGKPLANHLINRNATVTLCHSKTKNLKEITKTADILIVAIGKAKYITKDMVKENSIIIDVGINRVDNKLYGDVDYENVSELTSHITPVPGGIGPMTIASLGTNIVKAYHLKNKDN